MSNIREQIRIAVATKVGMLATTFTDYPLLIEYTNGQKVNTATQTNPYLKVTVRYQDGQQVDLALQPGHRLIGTLILEACVKEATGTAEANKLLEHFYPALHLTDTMPPLRTMAARFSTKQAVNGWAAEAALIPFWTDSVGP